MSSNLTLGSSFIHQPFDKLKKTMAHLDFLCDGDWRDSYESRLVNDNMTIESAGGYEVNNLQDILNVCRGFINSEKGKHTLELFNNSVSIYLDGELKGEIRDKHFILFPTTIIKPEDPIRIYYPYGRTKHSFNLNGSMREPLSSLHSFCVTW